MLQQLNVVSLPPDSGWVHLSIRKKD